MSTLLTMLNDLRVMLSEEQITSVSSTDTYTQALIRLINRSAADVLESRTWSFDKRDDGYRQVAGVQTGTEFKCTLLNPVIIESNTVIAAALASNAVVGRIRLTSDTELPGTSYRVVYGDTTSNPGSITLTVDPTWGGETPIDVTDGTWEVWAQDYVLPSTVRKILSVWDEEEPLQLEFSEDEIFLDRADPRPSDYVANPQVVIVGGTATASYDSDADSAGTTGMRFRIYPTPEAYRVIYYSYVYRHAEMSSATDTLTGVPDNIIRLIVDRALYYCFASDIEADPVRAARVEKQWRTDLALAGMQDRVTPNRRRVMRPIGSRLGRHPNYRWEDREVPSP